MNEICSLNLTALADALQKKEIGAEEATRACLDRIAAEYTAVVPALPAAHTAADGIAAEPEDLRFNAVFVELCRNLGQRGIGAAVLMRAAVDQ